MYAGHHPLGFPAKRWLELCEKHDAKDGSPPYRDEQRAWYDTLRDLVPVAEGLRPTVRLYARDQVWCSLDPENSQDRQRFLDLIHQGLTSREPPEIRFPTIPPAQPGQLVSSLRRYVANRLVIEGGFDPDWIWPRPPITVDRARDGLLLSHDPDAANADRLTLPGGLKAAKPDVTVTIPTIGPVLALSLEGTESAAVTRGRVPELTGGLERIAGACVNLHMIYPALVYGFWHVLGVSRVQDLVAGGVPDPVGGPGDNGDHARTCTGELAAELRRYCDALARLSERGDIRNDPSRYESCAVTVVEQGTGPQQGIPPPHYPPPESLLDYNRMFRRLYAIYDRRFVGSTLSLRPTTERRFWHHDSPLLVEATVPGGVLAEMEPRVGICPPHRPRIGEQKDDQPPVTTRDDVVARLDERHHRFFRDMGINRKTGMPARFPDSERRFACHPYVGSRYGESTRILFIGLDIGGDPGHLQSFETRRRNIEEKRPRDHNPHIAGTWCVALSLLPAEYGWDDIADSDLTCQQVLRQYPESHWRANPLSFVGLTNFYKWTTIRRDRASGGADRKHLSPEIEQRFLLDEIRIYRPEVVVFQGAGFRNRTHLEVVENLARKSEVRVLRHPSMRGKRRPRDVAAALWVRSPGAMSVR